MAEYDIRLSEEERKTLVVAMVRLGNWLEKAQEKRDEEADALSERLRTLEPAAPGSTISAVEPSLTKEVADRLHQWGDGEDMFVDTEDSFLMRVEQGEFSRWEMDWYDPHTRKVYHTFMHLGIDPLDVKDVDDCPMDGSSLVSMEGVKESFCQECGWSVSGIRHCAECGGVEGLKNGYTSCTACAEKEKKG